MNEKSAAVAIPVFSLRTAKGFGTGEFDDIKLLVDWAVKVGLKMIQLLPVNDTASSGTYKDSYPYSAISAFALHPLYINLEKVAGREHGEVIKPLKRKKTQLNKEADLNYVEVMKFKMLALHELFVLKKKILSKDAAYLEFIKSNADWLKPYAAFCCLRDKYKTTDHSKWKETYEAVSNAAKEIKGVDFYYFIQYHLHHQLKEAVAYAHKHGLLVKGDIAIGVDPHSVDTWAYPQYFNANEQAGAPPDDFATKGQNWGFPTYNWTGIKKDDYKWWRMRFEQMGKYFDAFRLDHILGFFRIWSIPIEDIEAVMGRFIPAHAIHLDELNARGIHFDYDRYCKPYITDEILNNMFGGDVQYVKETFLNGNSFKEEFNTQVKIENYFAHNKIENSGHIKQGLFDLLENVIFLTGEGDDKFHCRIDIHKIASFQHLDHQKQQQLRDLYIDYFYKRQEGLWREEGLEKLTALKGATEMLIFGEDLGMIPACVPDVMDQLGIYSLEVQRMPKPAGIEFSNLYEAPYLSVVTPSTHDMSTIREWWEEDRGKTQRFFNNILGFHGNAPFYCEPWIVKVVILQHLHSPAAWAVFQLQDLMGMDGKLRRIMPQEERINLPSDINHYWKYRMHISLEALNKEAEFNNFLSGLIKEAGR